MNRPLSRRAIVPEPCGERLVGVCAPASHFKRGDFEAGLRVLEGCGFRLRYSADLFQRKAFFAGDDLSRAAGLHELFADPEVGAIIAVRGGWGSLRILEHLDFGLIRRHPKQFIGFSDTTSLLAALYARSGLVCFHGPTLTSLPNIDAASVEALRALLREGKMPKVRPERPRLVRARKTAGRLVGGNLATLVSLLGTPYAPKTAGGLLMIEERGEKPYQLDRMLATVRLAGLLGRVRAVLVGDLVRCGRPALAVVLAALKELKVPVVTGYPFGHGARNIVVPIGARMELAADGLLRFAG